MNQKNAFKTPDKKQLLKTFTIPIYTPRTAYSLIREMDEILLNDLAINFDPFTINILQSEFAKRNNEIDKIDFINIVQRIIPSWQPEISKRQEKLVRCLTMLFNDIDINGNDNLDWEEFTNYIVDKANIMSTARSKNEIVDHYVKSKQTYHKIQSIQISKAIFIDNLNVIAYCEANRNFIYFIEPTNDNFKYQQLKIDGMVKSIANLKKATILDFISVQLKGNTYLFCSCNDGYVRIYRFNKNRFEENQESRNSKFPKEIRFDFAQLAIVWDQMSEVLFTGDRFGSISVWDKKAEPSIYKLGVAESQIDIKVLNFDNVKNKYKKSRDVNNLGSRNNIENSSREMSFESENELKSNVKTKFHNENNTSPIVQKIAQNIMGHTESIIAILPISKLQLLASAGMDRRIILWDTIKKTKRREYAEYHKKAIVSLQFNKSLILLFSGGVDHVIYVWNPYIDAPIHKLDGHNFPIVSLRIIEQPLHLISIDQKGLTKVWDLKRMKCYSEFHAQSHDEKEEPIGLVVIPNNLRLLVVGKGLAAFDYRCHSTVVSCDENVALCCHFIQSNLVFLTPVGSRVKIWNALTGDIKRVFSNLTRSEISSFAVDKFEKRIIVGDLTGYSGVFNIQNGILLKKLKGHECEIRYQEHVPAFNCIVSLDIENIVNIFDDEGINDSKVLKRIDLKAANLIDIQFENHQQVVTGLTNNFQILKIDVQSGKQFLHSTEMTDEPVAFCTLEKMLSFFIINSSNHIMLLGLPPLVLKYNILKTWTLQDLLSDSTRECKNADEINKEKKLHDQENQQKTKIIENNNIFNEIGQNFLTQNETARKNKSQEEASLNDTSGKFHKFANQPLNELEKLIEEVNLPRIKIIKYFVKKNKDNILKQNPKKESDDKDEHFIILADDRGYIHLFEFNKLAHVLLDHVSELRKKWLYDPKIPDDCLVHRWSVRVHSDQIQSAECYPAENFITTSCVDKSVCIVDIEDGHIIEFLLQNNMTSKLRPIAYKKVGKAKIVDALTGKRIDKLYLNYEAKMKQLLHQKNEGAFFGEYHIFDTKLREMKAIFDKENKIDFDDSKFNEFDPYYFINSEFNKSVEQHFRSNNWNLYVNFDFYYKDFDRKVKKTLEEIIEIEKKTKEIKKPFFPVIEGFQDFGSKEAQKKIEDAAVKELFNNYSNSSVVALPKIEMGKQKLYLKKGQYQNDVVFERKNIKGLGNGIFNAYNQLTQALMEYDKTK